MKPSGIECVRPTCYAMDARKLHCNHARSSPVGQLCPKLGCGFCFFAAFENVEELELVALQADRCTDPVGERMSGLCPKFCEVGQRCAVRGNKTITIPPSIVLQATRQLSKINCVVRLSHSSVDTSYDVVFPNNGETFDCLLVAKFYWRGKTLHLYLLLQTHAGAANPQSQLHHTFCHAKQRLPENPLG